MHVIRKKLSVADTQRITIRKCEKSVARKKAHKFLFEHICFYFERIHTFHFIDMNSKLYKSIRIIVRNIM